MQPRFQRPEQEAGRPAATHALALTAGTLGPGPHWGLVIWPEGIAWDSIGVMGTPGPAFGRRPGLHLPRVALRPWIYPLAPTLSKQQQVVVVWVEFGCFSGLSQS